MYKLILLFIVLSHAFTAQANTLHYEKIIFSAHTFSYTVINDEAVTYQQYVSLTTDDDWLSVMGERLKRFKPDQYEREAFCVQSIMRQSAPDSIRSSYSASFRLKVVSRNMPYHMPAHVATCKLCHSGLKP